MPLHLDQGPIDPHHPTYENMLRNLQGNILKAHERDHAVHIFLKFTAHSGALRRWIRIFTDQYV